MATVTELGVKSRAYTWDVEVGWFRSKVKTNRSEHADWLIDGTPLRRLAVPAEAEHESDGVTPVRNPDASRDLACGYLRTLLGTSATDAWRFADGRVALLCCPVDFDLDCGTLTAELVVTDTEVVWQNLGYQVSWQPFDLPQDGPPQDFFFDREQYEDLLHRLLRDAETDLPR